MKRLAALTLALSLVSGPLTAAAQNRGGGGGGGGNRSAPATRQAPAARPAQPAARPAPAKPQGGYKLNSDVRAGQAASRPATRPAAPSQPAARPPVSANPPQRPPNNGNPQRPPGNGTQRPNPPANPGMRPPGSPGYRPPANPPNNWQRPPGSNNYGYYSGYHGTRVVVVNPVYRGPAWGWNRGVIWYPAGAYWGGGFWGALAIGVASAAVFGAIVSANQQQVVSYQVSPDSPGATLLKNYQLTQVPCGPPNLVVIFGPNNSVICANPNHLVAPGEYDLDAQQLSIIAR